MKYIGYFRIIKEDENYVGGIMIADERGIPVEFKYTDIITPTKVQKVLYGNVLEKYLREEVIMANLIKKIENRTEMYVIQDSNDFYLEDFAGDVISVKHTQINPLKEINTPKVIKENEMVIQLEEKGSPIRVIMGEKTKEKKEEIVSKIIEFSEKMDITEPMKRIEEALSLICRGEL